ncbi:High-affinity glucose transporter [Elsinoe australis]|uniref:High-affinity glucose transporter n=1 Tax=Elsinoe australis TaxID=40998 RepID=A0A2P7Z1J4_9PEZI|nr:High-affinity glucose transporter [Elsinoe australis]
MRCLRPPAARATARVKDETRLKDVLPPLGKPWWRVSHLLRLNLLLTVPWASAYINGYDSSMLNGTQSLPIWIEDFDNPSGSRLGLMVSMSIIGMIAATPFTPSLVDRLGRRLPIVIGSIISCIGTALQTAAPHLSYFLAGRFFLGFGLGIAIGTSTPLLAELAYPSHRAIITSLYNTTWYIGAIAAAWITYGTYQLSTTWSWRIPAVLQCIPSVYQLLTIYLVPESPRWLISKGKIDEARHILTKYHAGGDVSSMLVDFEMNEISSAIENEKLIKQNSYLDFFMTSGNRWRLFIIISLGLMVQWTGSGLVSYYFVLVLESVGITDGDTQNIINGALQIFNLFSAILGAVSVDRVGRRVLLLTSLSGMFVAFVIWTTISALQEQSDFTNGSLGNAVVVMIFVFYFFYNIAFNPLPFAYVLEVMPFSLRAKGVSIFQASTLGGILFNSFVNPIALEDVAWRYYFCYLVLLVVWFAVVYFAYPETKSLSLEEVGEIFDGRDISTEQRSGCAAGSITDSVPESQRHLADPGNERGEAYELPPIPSLERVNITLVDKS